MLYLTLLVTLLAILLPTHAQTLPNISTDKPRPTSDYALRILGYSTTGLAGAFTPLLRAANADSIFLSIGDALEERISEPNCFLRSSEAVWTENTVSLTSNHGWPTPNTSCASSTRVRSTPFKTDAETVFARLQRFSRVLRSVKNRVHKTTAKNFDQVIFPDDQGAKDSRFRVCRIEKSFGIRIMSLEQKPLWYMLVGITNAPNRVSLPDWERQYVSEYVGVDLEGRKMLAPLVHNVFPVGTLISDIEPNGDATRGDYATVHEKWAGRVSTSAMYAMTTHECPAVQSAFDATSRDVAQATDGKFVLLAR